MMTAPQSACGGSPMLYLARAKRATAATTQGARTTAIRMVKGSPGARRLGGGPISFATPGKITLGDEDREGRGRGWAATAGREGTAPGGAPEDADDGGIEAGGGL